MMLYYSVNGKAVDHLVITDRGLAYGDGFFTTMKVVNGQVEFFDAHMQRLKLSSQIFYIDNIDFVLLAEELMRVAGDYALAVIKVIITAGSGGRGYGRSSDVKPNVVVSVHEFPSQYHHFQQSGINVATAETRIGLNPLMQGTKHLNRLEQVFVRRELDKCEFDDLIVCDVNECVIEASAANVFWQMNNRWYTSDLSQSGVRGIYRQKILEAFPNIEEVLLAKSALGEVSSMFLCNSVMGIVPVKQLNHQPLELGSVAQLIAQFEAINA